ncbi:hypothetical protein F2P81_013111 [Scophthalmus maximus]|uniref:Uncharacterized protein n=1 Tax=Scophthalmus maximus TaxID=52904 RepID=A0A6A4SMX0_SCOMX|nr:hypothetical protein F2P81_013111 [Scophthalmus maximus]
MYTRHSPVLKPRQRNILTLSKHKDKTHARRSAAACIVFVRRQHKRSNNLCCPPTKGMPRATAAREAYCIATAAAPITTLENDHRHLSSSSRRKCAEFPHKWKENDGNVWRRSVNSAVWKYGYTQSAALGVGCFG